MKFERRRFLSGLVTTGLVLCVAPAVAQANDDDDSDRNVSGHWNNQQDADTRRNNVTNQSGMSHAKIIMNGEFMRQKIEFKRDDVNLVGHLYTPNDFDHNSHYDAIIVQGSFTSVKEQMPAAYAQRFANEGFVALAFDYSHYGESEGAPRQVESPATKLSDLKAAVTYLTDLPYVKTVSMVGVCTSAGNAAFLASEDDRIKVMATAAAFLPDPSLLSGMFGESGITQRLEAGAAAKLKYQQTGEETIIPAYSEVDPSAVNFRPAAGSYDYYLNPARGGISEYKNEFAVMSWDTWLAFDPVSKASSVTIPAIVVHSDGCAFPDQVKKFYSQLQGEKELVWADGTHFDYYDRPAQIDNAVTNIARFFKKHLS